MSKKFKFSIDGTEFQLPISQVRDDSYNKEKYIYMNAKSAFNNQTICKTIFS